MAPPARLDALARRLVRSSLNGEPLKLGQAMEQPTKHKLAAILMAGVVGYSRLMGEDEAAIVRTLKS